MTLEYHFPNATFPYLWRDEGWIRNQIWKHEPAVKAALCILANDFMKASKGSFALQGIFKHEGGIVVNKREIAVGQNMIYDNNLVAGPPTGEEYATLYALQQIISDIQNRNTGRVKQQYGECYNGDPMRGLAARLG